MSAESRGALRKGGTLNEAIVFDVARLGEWRASSESLGAGRHFDQGWGLRAERCRQRLLQVIGRGGAHALHAIALGEGDKVDTRHVKLGRTFHFQYLRKPTQGTIGAVL